MIWADFPFAAVGEQFGLVGCARAAAAVRRRAGAHLAHRPPVARPVRHVPLRRRVHDAALAGVPEHRHDRQDHAGHRPADAVHLLRRVGRDHLVRPARARAERAHAADAVARHRSGRLRGHNRPHGTSWARLEPLLGQVQKPARYIGCEDGAIVPRHGPGTGVVAARLPRHVRGRPAQPGAADPLRDHQRARRRRRRAHVRAVARPRPLLRREGIPLFSVDTHRPAGEFDLLAFNLSSELVFTNLLNMVDLAGVPVRAADRRPRAPAGRHRRALPRSTRSRSPTSSMSWSSVRARRSSARSPRSSVPGSRRAGRSRGGAARAHPGPWRVRPSMYDVSYDGPAIVAVTPRYPDVPATVDKRTVADLGQWPYPKRQLVPLTEVVHDRLNVEVFRGCTRGCRFCQAGMITRPVRERPAEQVRTMVAEGSATHRLRRGQPDVAVDGRLQRHRAASSATSSPIARRRRRAARRRSTCRRCASTRSPSAWPDRSPVGGAAG